MAKEQQKKGRRKVSPKMEDPRFSKSKGKRGTGPLGRYMRAKDAANPNSLKGQGSTRPHYPNRRTYMVLVGTIKRLKEVALDTSM